MGGEWGCSVTGEAKEFQYHALLAVRTAYNKGQTKELIGIMRGLLRMKGR